MRQFILSLSVFFGVLLLSVLCVSSSHAQTTPATATPIPVKVTLQSGGVITVTNLDSDGPGSFLYAIYSANSGDTIVFAENLSGQFRSKGGENGSATDGFLLIDRDLTIKGPSSRQIIFQGASITLLPRISVTFKNLTFVGGSHTISNENGILNLVNCNFRNSGLSNIQGHLNITSSTFEGGDGIYTGKGSLTSISGTLFSRIQTAFINEGGTVQIADSTFYDNDWALTSGKGSIEIINSTFQVKALLSHGIAGDTQTVTLRNSVITLASWGLINSRTASKICDVMVIDGGNNLQFPTRDCSSTIPVGDPKLAPLADNGGATQTMALLPGSAAIGAGDSKVCASIAKNMDQRGFVLPVGSTTCDVGAYQTQAVSK